MADLVAHLEYFLGVSSGGWLRDPDQVQMPFGILRFNDVPALDTIAYATLGLSHRTLVSRRTGKEIHQELLMLIRKPQMDLYIPSILHQVGMALLTSGKALLRGEVVGPAGPIAPMSPMEALYVAAPIYLPDEFATYSDGEEQVVIAWLVPIFAAEAELIARKGWRSFEDLLAATDPDLTDVRRKPLATD